MVRPLGSKQTLPPVVFHRAEEAVRSLQKAQRASPALQGYQRDAVMRRALVLHGDRDRIVRPHGQMADAEPMQSGVERQFAPQRAAPPIHETERRRHGGQVELDARQVGMSRDAAVGDGQCLAVGEQPDLVRADAVGGKLAHAHVASRRVVDADDAAFALEIVLGGVEQPPVRAEDAVPIERSVGRRFPRRATVPCTRSRTRAKRPGRLAKCTAALPSGRTANE